MNLAGWILKKAGWKFAINIPPTPKCVIAIAPHTSNWDFILGELAIRSVGMKAGFLMKDTWFFFPLGYFMRAIGGIPVKQSKHTRVTDDVVEAFNTHDELVIGLTPEGTRSRNEKWRTGFMHIAREANVPLALAYIDYGTRTVCIDRFYELSGDIDNDMAGIKEYFSHFTAKFPEKFGY
ncbi:MAG: 1-acyl-sn-glycerol-3-phosphate acyltransferase [Muribaculaceae bacterium]|nr:1-acyl-sn-glycerol-3-phosphate acyltransferase [Muribaculaceae bacterium]